MSELGWLAPTDEGVRFPAWAAPARAVEARPAFRPPSAPPDQDLGLEPDSSPPAPPVEAAPLPTRTIAPAPRRSSIPSMERRSSLPAQPIAVRAEAPPDPSWIEARDAFAEAAVAMAAARADALAEIEEDLRHLAVEIAEAVLGEEVLARPELHAALARAALEALDPSAPARLRASRASYDAIVARYGGPAIELPNGHVDVILDPHLEGLGVVAESGDTRADGRVRERLDAVRRALASHRRHTAKEGA